ncbi:hypothetical protein [Actinotalea sp. K2]|uniref:hypothetical protein n=1 Tax=Actinotalea sp. K2 TaxID=2939438 RepID=UPI002018328B|nr:hypothetical protein [Actinotalea sp. K2]MCL3861245.1 hypothetical protein [Actinotalea sp. K2]
MNLTVTYRLPVSRIVVRGRIRRSTDTLYPTTDSRHGVAELTGTTVSVVTEADDRALTVTPPTKGWLSAYQSSFTTTSDGRLTSAASESTGALGRVITSVVTVAGSLVGWAALGSDQADLEDATRALGAATPFEATKFAEVKKEEYDRAIDLLRRRRRIREQTDQVIDQAIGQPGASRGRLAELTAMSRDVTEELGRLQAVYAAWRASTRTVTEEPFELRITPSALPATSHASGTFSPGPAETPAPTTLGALARDFGIGVHGTWVRPASGRTTTTEPPSPRSDQILVRRPDVLEVTVTQHKDSRVLLLARSRHLVVDEHSTHEAFTLTRSRWGRRSLSLAFDGDGLLTTIGTEGDAVLATAAEALAGVPAAFAGGIEGATSVDAALRAARSAAAEADLATLTREIDLREKRLLSAGLDATEGDAVGLQRLQQLQQLLQAQKEIRAIDPTLVEALRPSAGGDLDWYTRPPAGGPPDPQVVRLIVEQAGPSTNGTPAGPTPPVALNQP